MFYLFSQVWILILVALVLGFVAGWLFWARPIQRAADARSRDHDSATH